MMRPIRLLAAVVLVAGDVAAASAQTQPIFLSADQFAAVRFPASTEAMKPRVRDQLKGTFPNARSDTAAIDWTAAPFDVVAAGTPTLAFEQPEWHRIGTTTIPATGPVAAEAYFNCGTVPETRQISASDVRTAEAEETRTRAVVRKDSVKTTVTLRWTPPSVGVGGMSFSGGLGGEAAKEWQKSVERSDEWVYRTKETIQTSDTTTQTVTVAPLSLRFFEYRVQSTTEKWDVVADGVIDMPVRARYRRPAYTVRDRILIGFPVQFTTIRRTVPAKAFDFDIGLWSYYIVDADRTVKQRAEVTINRQTTILGPVAVQFDSAAACTAARAAFTQNGTNPGELVALSTRLKPAPSPLD